MLSFRWKNHAAAVVVLVTGSSGTFSLAGAQEIASSCDYETCALRIEPGGFFSGASIVRGATGEVVAGYGGSVVLDSLFQVSDSAAAWYEEFEKSHRTATWLARAGALLYLAGALVPIVTDRTETAEVWFGLSIGAVGFAVASSFPARSAARSLSRAIWWYNAGLTR